MSVKFAESAAINEGVVVPVAELSRTGPPLARYCILRRGVDYQGPGNKNRAGHRVARVAAHHRQSAELCRSEPDRFLGSARFLHRDYREKSEVRCPSRAVWHCSA